jgi:hypothetical protein
MGVWTKMEMKTNNELNIGCDYNPNKPMGSTKKTVEYSPILEQFNKYSNQGLYCSIDKNAPPAPFGSREYFERHGYVIIKNLYDPKELYEPVPNERGQINYFGSVDNFRHTPDEMQVPGSIARYSHPKYKQIHTNIRLILEDILGEKLYNTYYYDRFYFAGQRLIRHKDRDACEISVSVQVSSNSSKPWPFCIETPNEEERSLNLQDGWGLLYKGCEREHWRDPLKSRHSKFKRILNKISRKRDDTYHHQIFFHYVRANGPRVHCANDAAN